MGRRSWVPERHGKSRTDDGNSFARLIPTKPKVTTERVARLGNKSGHLPFIPHRYILLVDDFGRQRILASSLLAGSCR
jgi:hypothetical protein